MQWIEENHWTYAPRWTFIPLDGKKNFKNKRSVGWGCHTISTMYNAITTLWRRPKDKRVIQFICKQNNWYRSEILFHINQNSKEHLIRIFLPTHLGRLPLQMPSLHCICLLPSSWYFLSQENVTHELCLRSRHCPLPFAGNPGGLHGAKRIWKVCWLRGVSFANVLCHHLKFL